MVLPAGLLGFLSSNYIAVLIVFSILRRNKKRTGRRSTSVPLAVLEEKDQWKFSNRKDGEYDEGAS
jgi:hypothetical protein